VTEPDPVHLRLSDVMRRFDVDRRVVQKWLDAELLDVLVLPAGIGSRRIIRITRSSVEAFERAHLTRP
jgi:hypothetical protein